eukprot:TRINITY_DN511_c2_g1_i13.p1 TRINITY_DN511_c2_g1~~TRINITY_DN511_c2_g1_i13.p1  ORF type:complete len:374 (+),score=100.49 TRINITY_DN511_c2_g1_i13:185-1306(+)
MSEQDVAQVLVEEGAKAAPQLTADIFLAYSATVIMAMIPIYIGSWMSAYRKSEPSNEAEGEEEEVMTTHDAYMFPVMGSVVLVSLYLLFKFLDKDLVNLLLTIYFLFIGFIALAQTFGIAVRAKVPSLASTTTTYSIDIPFMSEPLEIVYDKPLLVGAVISFLILAWYTMTKSWLANNLIGLCFCIQGISMINLGSYKVGAILLGGLFFYDIWWVFFTDVMVTVAKNFDAPIKFLFPKNFFTALATGDPFQFSLLGLGDAVIPGVFIALLLRYDIFRHNRTNNPKDLSKVPVGLKTPYFTHTLIGYAVGLITTIVVMHTFQAAQPALLYLVPTCLGFSAFTAILLGDVSAILSFDESVVEEGKEKKNESKKEK